MLTIPTGEKARGSLKQLTGYREAGVFFTLLLFFSTMMIISPTFRQPFNLTIVLKQMSVTAILAMGQTVVMIAGSFDLSQGSIAGLSAMAAAMTWERLSGAISVSKGGVGGMAAMAANLQQNWRYAVLLTALSILAGLAVGVLCGVANGVLAAKFRLHTTVMTLATGIVFRGINYYVTQGKPVIGLPSALLYLGEGNLGPVPACILLMLFVTFVTHIVLTRTLYGRRVLQIGGNEDAARRSGILVDRVRIGVFAASGFLAALGGIVTIGRVGNAIPLIGQDLLFPVVTAAIVGGTLLTGGVGSALGTLMGGAIMAIVNNALVVLQFSIYVQDMCQGLLVVLALLLDQFRRGALTLGMLTGKDR